jgi:DNA-binding protein H-NS
MSINLEQMSFKELSTLKSELDTAMIKAKSRERREALKAAEDAVAKFGFTLADVQGRKSTAKEPLAAKYQNPADASQTWSGRGRKPKWVHEALANGADMSALEI